VFKQNENINGRKPYSLTTRETNEWKKEMFSLTWECFLIRSRIKTGSVFIHTNSVFFSRVKSEHTWSRRPL